MQRHWRLFVSTFTLVIFAALTVTPRSPAIAEDDENGSLVGSWIGTISFVSPSGSPPLIGLYNINRDGTISGTDGGSQSSDLPPTLCPAPCPLAVDHGGQFGSWVRDGHHQFAATLKAPLFAGPNTPTEIYGQLFSGQNVGLGTLQVANITLQHTASGDTLTGKFTVQYESFFLNQVVITTSGTFSFSRVAIEPLATP